MLPMWEPENFKKLWGSLHSVRMLAQELGIKTSQLVLAWTLAHGITPLPGSSNFEHNVSNIDAFQIKLDPDVVHRMDMMTYDMYDAWKISRYSKK